MTQFLFLDPSLEVSQAGKRQILIQTSLKRAGKRKRRSAPTLRGRERQTASEPRLLSQGSSPNSPPCSTAPHHLQSTNSKKIIRYFKTWAQALNPRCEVNDCTGCTSIKWLWILSHVCSVIMLSRYTLISTELRKMWHRALVIGPSTHN